jgi:hypothetical protein
MVAVKNLYKGLFSFRCELEIHYAYAHSKEQAKTLMCRKIAKKHDVHPSVVFGMFDDSKPNYEITLEMEIKEDEKDVA